MPVEICIQFLHFVLESLRARVITVAKQSGRGCTNFGEGLDLFVDLSVVNFVVSQFSLRDRIFHQVLPVFFFLPNA